MFNTNVLEAARINKVKKLVYTSSIGAYANQSEVLKEEENRDLPPMDFFSGWAKRMGEYQIQAYKVQYGMKNFAVVRPCNVYGPGDNFDPHNAMVIPSLIYRLYNKENPIAIWGDGSAVRDFAYSRDLAEGVILALHYGTSDASGGFVNLGSGVGYSVKELVETFRQFIEFDYYFDATKPSGFAKRVLDISSARKIIHYNPTTSLLEGLEKTWEWYQQNQLEYQNKKNYFAEASKE
jgi:GDP-L-fucose synthase